MKSPPQKAILTLLFPNEFKGILCKSAQFSAITKYVAKRSSLLLAFKLRSQ